MYKKITVLSILIGILFSCTKHHNTTINSNVKLDSINKWIKEGENTNIDVANRKRILTKTHHTLKELPNDSIKLEYASDLSWAAYKLNDTSLFKTVNKNTIQLAVQLKDSSTQATAHWDYSSFYRNYGIQDSAYYHAIATHKLYTALGDSYRAGRVLNLISGIQSDVKDFTGAEITAIKALKLLKSTNHKNKYRHLYSSYTNLAIANRGLKEYKKAIDFYKKAEEALKKYKGSRLKKLQLSLLNNIANVYSDSGDHQKAITNFKQVLATDSLYFTNTKLYAKALNNLTHSRLKLGDTTNILQQLKKTLFLRDSIGDIEGLAYSNYCLAKYYLNHKDTINAIKYGKASKAAAKKSKNYSRLLEMLQLCTHINPKRATKYSQQYISLNDSLQQAERKIRNKFTRIRFETDEYIEENEHLEEQRKILLGLIIGGEIRCH